MYESDTYTSGFIAGSSVNDKSNNNGFGCGGDWAWLIIILLFCGWGNGYGFGGGQGGALGTYATQSDIQRGFDTNTVQRKLNDIGDGLCDGFYAQNTSMLNGFNGINMNVAQGFNGVNTAMVTQGYETRNAIQGVGTQLASCCCDLKQQFGDLKYLMASDTCAIQNTIQSTTRDIIDSQRASTDAIIGFLTNEKISTLNRELAQAQGQLSQAQQTNNIINALKPCPSPAYVVPNPYCCYTPCGTPCGNGVIQ